jgi:hypothetical protein
MSCLKDRGVLFFAIGNKNEADLSIFFLTVHKQMSTYSLKNTANSRVQKVPS